MASDALRVVLDDPGAIYKDGIPILIHPFVDTVAIDLQRRKGKAPAGKK